MQRMKPSEVRRRWFSVLDRVAAGEVIAIERNGRLVVLRRETRPGVTGSRPPDYRRVLRVPQADQADRWRWDWVPSTGKVKLRTRKR